MQILDILLHQCNHFYFLYSNFWSNKEKKNDNNSSN